VGLEQQLTGLVQVRRLDSPDAYLVAPDQGYFLRANLKLRLLSARLSLLARNQATLRSDLAAADGMLLKYFDSGSPTTQTVLGLVRQVEPAAADLQLPNLDASLAAVHQYKSGS
jgi:uroporphyrinogen III methyltransferase/synthase